VLKRAVLSLVRRLAREQKNSGQKFFLFIGHEVLFYETPFLHRARRNYVCGQSEEVSRSDGSSLEFWDLSAFFYLTWSFVLWNDLFRVHARTLSANQATTEAADRGDREADYMCFSPLRRKTSELEVEEEYSRLVSRNLCDWRQN
jgi:hypothetical protein